MYIFKSLLEEYRTLWYKSDKTVEPSLIRTYQTKNHRKKNDKNLVKFKKELISFLKKIEPNEELENHQKDMIKDRVMEFLEETMGVSRINCETLDGDDGYFELTLDFIRRAKELDESLTIDDIFQGMSNVWVMVSLQMYFGLKIVLSDSMFAYSMLYPLTDNYLDNPNIPLKEKKNFNKRFYSKIKSNKGFGRNHEEEMIFSMIDYIEKDYPRPEYPEIYKSLLAILDGQNKSLEQQSMKTLFSIDLLGYTFYKGGSSVLADAYLVKGKLSKDEAMFAYGYGIILQIADDLKDGDEDLRVNHNTIVNTQARSGNLDDLYNHYEAFINTFLDQIFIKETKSQKSLYAIIKVSIEQLLYCAVLENMDHYSKKHMKKYLDESRFTASSFQKLNKKLKKVISEIY